MEDSDYIEILRAESNYSNEKLAEIAYQFDINDTPQKKADLFDLYRKRTEYDKSHPRSK